MTTIKDRQELLDELPTRYPDNNRQLISPEDVREQQTSTIENAMLQFSNDAGVVYVNGDDFTEGSVRMRPEASRGTRNHVALEHRHDGVWNRAGLSVSGSTIFLGREVALGSAGSFIQTIDENAQKKALHCIIVYDPENMGEGSLETGYLPTLAPRQDQVVIQPDDSEEFVGPAFSFDIQVGLGDRLTTTGFIKVGSVVPTGNVELMFRREDENGTQLFDQIYPQAFFDEPEGTILELSFDGSIEFSDEVATFVEFRTDDGSDLSIQTNASGLTPWAAITFYNVAKEPVLTFETADKKMLCDNQAETVFDNEGGVMFIEVTF